MKILLLLITLTVSSQSLFCFADNTKSAYKRQNKTIIFTSLAGNKLRVSAYGKDILRLQTASAGQSFLPDDHYEMVESHLWLSQLNIESNDKHWQLSPKQNTKLTLQISKQTLQATFLQDGRQTLAELRPPYKSATQLKTEFVYDPNEHFTGLGHSFYGREPKLDLKGQRTSRNYGETPIEQAPLIVPFYLSSKGYGVFLNSTFSNEFSFGVQNEYSMTLDGHGFTAQMDYFYIAGGTLGQVLNNYTQLTGRPRLPPKAMFGLQLSDKGHDHDSPTPSNEKWWKQKISEHRKAGYPLDHVINDNRWRAAGGKRCESKIEWDKARYPDPAGYQQWLVDNQLVLTLDFNRCIARYSEGWDKAFNLPDISNIEFPNSAPDLTNADFRSWFWNIFFDKSLNPDKHFPGDALWIDEFDEQGGAEKTMLLSNGRSSAEMRNYWFFLIAKALVADGWDKSSIDKRPFVWVRGMTAGAQRYATLWSGDIYPNYADMQSQIRAMQLAGLSGFPFWGHDAGGFYDWKNNLGPDEAMYQQWAAAFGSFAPIWKPHGMGQSRWPLDRSEASQKTFSHFAQLRYQLMPYLYTMAHKATSSGLPIARAMVLDYQHEPNAWKFDLQYMWGDALLVAPQTKKSGAMQIWLPPGQWYEYGRQQRIQGDSIKTLTPQLNELPIYVKAGSIIPQRIYASSTGFIDKTQLKLDFYAGASSSFTLIEDDDRTEAFKTKQAIRSTKIDYAQHQQSIIIDSAKGTYADAPPTRQISIRLLGFENISKVVVNAKPHVFTVINGIVHLTLAEQSVEQNISIHLTTET